MTKSGFSRHLLLLTSLALTGSVVSLAPTGVYGQATSGDLVGTVTDPSGATIPHASIVATNINTGITNTTESNDHGEFRISNLLGGRYNIKGSAPGFSTFTLENFTITLNQTATAALKLPVASASTSVEVSSQAATAIDTTTIQLGQTFSLKESQDLPTATIGLGALNLSLLSPGVATSGGIGAGTGPSVGGQRPRNNNFTIEGIDDNDKGVTGPLLVVPNDATGEFTLLTNQFSPEFGHSSGGQFNTTILGGTNTFHGRAYEYFQNRNLNAIDAGTVRGIPDTEKKINPRFDQNRFGGQIGGPVFKDKLFFFSNFEKYQLGQNLAYPVCTPTAAGYAVLAATPGVSATNLSILQQYVPASAAPDTTAAACPGPSTTVAGQDVAIGALPVSNSYFNNTYQSTSSVDYTKSQTDQFRFRYMYVRTATTDTAAYLAAFWQPTPLRYHLLAFSYFHEFTPNLTNEARIGFNRYVSDTPSGSFEFPGVDSFPNLSFDDLNFLQVGPDPNAPQSTVQNLYQIVDNITWVKGNHTIKFGFDGRKYISPQTFTQRVRGDYEYANIGDYITDSSPTTFGERSTGNFFYYGDQTAFYGFGNDIWRLTPHLSINYGLRYEFTSVPTGWRNQQLNVAATVPGLLNFHAPQPQYKNFAPRVGFAFAPGDSGDWSIRGGFGMGYDVLYDNIGLLSLPPQFSSTQDVNTSAPTANFLASGGLPPGDGTLQTFPDVAAQRQATSSYLPDQKLPYSEQWNLSVQHVFLKDYTAEIRYVGTRGLHLPVQTQLNRQAIVTETHSLPVFNSAPDPGSLSGLPSRSDFTPQSAGGQSYLSYVPAYAAAGFGPTGADDANGYSNLTSYQPFGTSTYHGVSGQITRRLHNGLQLNAAYTFSRALDNSTADVFSTVLTPRRPQDFQNVNRDYGVSALNHTHRLTVETIWDIPYFKNSDSRILKNVLGNWEIAPIYTYQSPQIVDVQSVADANLNGDAAGDRAIFNPSGVKGTGSGVIGVYDPSRAGLCATDDNPDATDCSASLVGYRPENPNAQYITAAPGVYANSSRNTLPIRPTNNWDATALKRVNFTERYALEFQAQAFNLFNHSQYISGYLNQINSFGDTGTQSYLNPSSDQFNHPELVFPNNARTMQLGLKFLF